MSVRNAALAAGFLAALLLPISVNAEAALADLYILLPQMLMLGVYLQIKKFFWLIVTLAAVSWGLQGIARYYRENGVHDPLQAETTLLLFHRFINGIGVVALLWLVLTHLLFGEEKLATLHAYMAEQEAPKLATPRSPEPLPLMNPFGGQWPDRMGYLQGAPLGASRGSTSIVISNSQSQTPVYIKLCDYGDAACSGIRHVYIGARWYFRMENVTPGEYELRFLQTTPHGKAAKSRKIIVTGEKAADEITWQIPLNPAHSGPPDMQFTAIEAAAF